MDHRQHMSQLMKHLASYGIALLVLTGITALTGGGARWVQWVAFFLGMFLMVRAYRVFQEVLEDTGPGRRPGRRTM